MGRLRVLKFPRVNVSHYMYVYRISDLHDHLTASAQIACSVRNYIFLLLGVVGYRSKLILPRKFSVGLYRFAKSISLSNSFPPYVSYRFSAVCRRGSV